MLMDRKMLRLPKYDAIYNATRIIKRFVISLGLFPVLSNESERSSRSHVVTSVT